MRNCSRRGHAPRFPRSSPRRSRVAWHTTCIVHTATHVRVEGEVLHLEQKLPGCRGRDGGLLEAEIGEPRPLLWSRRENDLSPTCCHGATFSLSEMWARWARPRPNEMFSPGVS